MKGYKHTVRFLITLLLLLSCDEPKVNKNMSDDKVNTQSDDKLTEIAFDNIFHDFGEIKEGDIVETIFEFTNTGTKDLFISHAVGSCGCTVPNYPKNIPIKPGESGEIEINFDSSNMPNIQSKLIKVFANIPSGSVFLRIQALVEPKK
tara:strand:- start:498 stop:941 length:444 start_codon:yes stop_codon:yes gene_type:complete